MTTPLTRVGTVPTVLGALRVYDAGPVDVAAGAMLSKHSRLADPAFAKQFIAGANALDKAEASRAMRSVDVNRTSVVDGLDRITAPTLVIAGGG